MQLATYLIRRRSSSGRVPVAANRPARLYVYTYQESRLWVKGI